jgi:hypothetical protein
VTTTNLHRPEPLADFLARGGNPRDVLLGGCHYEMFIESVWNYADMSPTWLEHLVELDRAHVESSLKGEPLQGLAVETGGSMAFGPIVEQVALTRTAWTADLLADFDTLAPQLVATMEPDVQAKVQRRQYQVLHPHPLNVERQHSGARCTACGTVFEDGEVAMTIGGQADEDGAWSEPVDGAWCYPCLAIVAEAMKAARDGGSVR